MVVHNFVLEAGDELRVTCAAGAAAADDAPRYRNNNVPNNNVPNKNVPNNNVPNNNVPNNNSQFGGKKGKNATRKQEGGKKKLSGFMKFSKEQRPNIMKENPGIEFTQVGKKLGEKWRSLSAAEKARY